MPKYQLSNSCLSLKIKFESIDDYYRSYFISSYYIYISNLNVDYQYIMKQ